MDNSSKITAITGTAIPLAGNDIDTDRIIPARFLRCVTFDGLGEQVFRDERFNGDEEIADHPFNDPRFRGGSILIVHSNFGCGSSREHAPQALLRFGVKAIIGESFAEIFAGNCTNLGIPVFTADSSTVESLMELVTGTPKLPLSLDLATASLSVDGRTIALEITPSSQTALLEGSWDSLGTLLQNMDEIEKCYERLPYLALG